MIMWNKLRAQTKAFQINHYRLGNEASAYIFIFMISELKR